MDHPTRWMSLGVTVLVLACGPAWGQHGSPAAANVPGVQEGLEKLSSLDFEGAYVAFREVGRDRGPAGQAEEAEVLRTVIALGETVAHVRLLHAYASQLAGLRSPELEPGGGEGVADTLRS